MYLIYEEVEGCLSEHMTYIIVLRGAKPASVQKVGVLVFISINQEKLIST